VAPVWEGSSSRTALCVTFCIAGDSFRVELSPSEATSHSPAGVGVVDGRGTPIDVNRGEVEPVFLAAKVRAGTVASKWAVVVATRAKPLPLGCKQIEGCGHLTA
jgi:hypothetical protein